MQQLHKNHGFAIGPILLAIALMAVITAFISLGANNSASLTENEKIRSLANIIISQGDEIKQAYSSARQTLGYDQDEVLLEAAGCAASEYCMYDPNSGSLAEPSIPSLATTQDTTWEFLEKNDFGWDGYSTDNCEATNGMNCNILVLRYITAEVCLMINHLSYNKPFKAVALTDTANAWSNPVVITDTANLFLDTANFYISGTDYHLQTKGCVEGPSSEFIYFTFLDG